MADDRASGSRCFHFPSVYLERYLTLLVKEMNEVGLSPPQWFLRVASVNSARALSSSIFLTGLHTLKLELNIPSAGSYLQKDLLSKTRRRIDSGADMRAVVYSVMDSRRRPIPSWNLDISFWMSCSRFVAQERSTNFLLIKISSSSPDIPSSNLSRVLPVLASSFAAL